MHHACSRPLAARPCSVRHVPFGSRRAVAVHAAGKRPSPTEQGAADAPVSPPSDTRERMKQLSRDLQACVKAEDYERAAVLRRQLDQLEGADPLLSLTRALKEAVAREEYQEAARLQRQLAELEATASSSSEQGGAWDLASASTSSDCTTAGIRVQVQSFFSPGHSRPGLWMFTYRVQITNKSKRVAQLKSRHWVITDEEGHKEEVKGPGVVGAQPVLLPGKSFEYMSGCPLRCQQGTMEGTYTFVLLDEEDGTFKDELSVRIGRFKLSAEGEAIM